jgi:adenylate cyclase
MPKDPESAARALRAWHAGLIEAVFTQDGMVMGVSGDAFTACFGVLDDDADSVMRACRAAIRMKAIGQELGGGVLASLAIRIGIDTGPCIVGDLSARGAARWSVAGSPTDLASRLQALTTRYGTAILASGAVREIAASAFLLRSLDTLRVEGTGVTVQVFDLFAEREGADEVTVQMIAQFEEGRERFERRDWQGALALFGRVLALRQSDGPAALFAERCRQLAADPDRPISFPAW